MKKALLLTVFCLVPFAFAPAFADPIVMPMNIAAPVASPRGNTNPRAATNARPTAPVAANVAANPTSVRTTTNRVTTTAVRGVTPRTVATRTTPSRAVVARTAAIPVSAAAASASSATRVSLTGTAMRGSGTSTSSLLYNSLYTGSYSNVIDPSTGLISADAYNNCMTSYYACMDDICTARNPGQRRCACADRIKTFTAVEDQLNSAKEDLIKVSGELALFIASGGKEVSAAFTLTDAEKVMNCASWNDTNLTGTAEEKANWCVLHGNPTGCSPTDSTSGGAMTPPDYCSEDTVGLGQNWYENLNGSGTDIYATLQKYASTIDSVNVITTTNNDNLLNAFGNVSTTVDQLYGQSGLAALTSTSNDVDTLAQTWGYDLFIYAHNNVCNRVLDSCFNGIYEACGSPSGGEKCGNGQSQCPYNLNHTIQKNANGDLDFIQSGNSYNNANSASCFGYASSLDTARGLTNISSDPYSSLRMPVADARRSILQKYALDANADCDAYGNDLKTQVQNVQLQKVAATQALEQKRLEFAQNAASTQQSDYETASSNFNQCLAEILDCYNTQAGTNGNPANNTTGVGIWTDARIKSYCTGNLVPHCYQPMICDPSGSSVAAVIDVPDTATDGKCTYSNVATKNTCRNVTSLSEILYGATRTAVTNADLPLSEGDNTHGSAELREACLQQAMGIVDGHQTENDIRGWKNPYTSQLGI